MRNRASIVRAHTNTVLPRSTHLPPMCIWISRTRGTYSNSAQHAPVSETYWEPMTGYPCRLRAPSTEVTGPRNGPKACGKADILHQRVKRSRPNVVTVSATSGPRVTVNTVQHPSADLIAPTRFVRPRTCPKPSGSLLFAPNALKKLTPVDTVRRDVQHATRSSISKWISWHAPKLHKTSKFWDEHGTSASRST